MALPVGQDPGDPHARLEAFLEAAELATLPGRQVDLARLSLRAEEYLVVPRTAKCMMPSCWYRKKSSRSQAILLKNLVHC